MHTQDPKETERVQKIPNIIVVLSITLGLFGIAITSGIALYKKVEKERVEKVKKVRTRTLGTPSYTYWKNCIVLPREKGKREDSITILAPPVGTKTAPCVKPRLGGYYYGFESDNNEPFWREINTRPGELVSYDKGDQRNYKHEITPAFRFYSKTNEGVPITFTVKKR